jgi:hypothetical protein
VASLSQGRTAAAQSGLFTHKSVPVIFEPPCIYHVISFAQKQNFLTLSAAVQTAPSITTNGGRTSHMQDPSVQDETRPVPAGRQNKSTG